MTGPAELEFVNCGEDRGRGNLLGVQPWLTPRDYAREETLQTLLAGYLTIAGEKGWLGPRTVVVFPEYTAAWLAIQCAPQAVYSAKTSMAALRALALRRLPLFLRTLLQSHEPDRAKAALFRMLAPQTARSLTAVFGHLARSFQVTVVAGSAILPPLRIEEGALFLEKGPLSNTTMVFQPNGAVHPQPTRKLHPIADETGFVARGRAEDLPVYETPAGPLGVLICADAWYPDGYEALRVKGARLLAVPSLLGGYGTWEVPWRGYSGEEAPPGVDASLKGHISEGEAWRRYALEGRFPASGMDAAVNIFLHGRLWDLGSDAGQSLALSQGQTCRCVSPGEALLNCWI